MHLTKALAAISAGSLLLIGHSTLAYAQDDPYTDETRDQQSETTQDDTTSQDYQASTQDDDTWSSEDDSWSSDTETTAQTDETRTDESSSMDTYAQTDTQDDDSYSADVDVDSESSVAATETDPQDDEFSADVDVDSESSVAATESDPMQDDWDVDVDADSDTTVAATDDPEMDVDADVDTSTSASSDAELQEQVASIDVEVSVDEQKIQELAQIHVEMQDETRDLADQMSGASSTADAQELQAQMVDRQVAVIERHGWTRDEYNAVVDTVNENPDLRAQFIEEVVNSDSRVARTESEDPSQPAPEDPETDW